MKITGRVSAFFILLFLHIRLLFGAEYVLVGWNDLGMHCMDPDYSVFSLLPPYNTIHARLIERGRVVDTNGYTVSYEAVAEETGSINRTSLGKVNFWEHAKSLYGVELAGNMGLGGYAMPGEANQPQSMGYDSQERWFQAVGIPIIPTDDQGRPNPYPMMRLTARDAAGRPVANTDIVLPVSDEMSCKACHLSGANRNTRPVEGWIWNLEPDKDYRLNILRLHDNFNSWREEYAPLLAGAGYNTNGLFPTVVADGSPILCARCHKSNALPGTGVEGVPPLTQAIHHRHAAVEDPLTGITLDSAQNRSACYRCHPGAETRCLRGAMGSAVEASGNLSMQCQNCHGAMSAVARENREGWLDQPNCQGCHTGTAVSNNGAIRYTSVFEGNGQRRTAKDQRFATQPNTPGPGLSLYRFSKGHGGLQCEACHGSTHAEYPSSHSSDNVQSIALQGHGGVISDCATCHTSVPNTTTGGPHGMHPIGQNWVKDHGDRVERSGASGCQDCHGRDYRGTVLSRALGDRNLSAFGSKRFWRGFQIGCYTCHRGPSSDDANSNSPAQVDSVQASTTDGQPVILALSGRDSNSNPLTWRIVEQPRHGRVGLTNNQAIYFPDSGFSGSDSFTFAAWDGSTDSNLATGRVAVTPLPAQLVLRPQVPRTAPLGKPIPFWGFGPDNQKLESAQYEWDFGDGQPGSTNQFSSHTYVKAGAYRWTFRVYKGTNPSSADGLILIYQPEQPPYLLLERETDTLRVTWPGGTSGWSLEIASRLSGEWRMLTNWISNLDDPGELMVQPVGTAQFYRLRSTSP